MSRNFGLVNKNDGERIPLESIKVQVNVTGFTAHVVASLNYNNKEDNPIEAIYVFPLDEQAAVCGFQATIDGRTIVAEVQEKQEARDTYDDAISSGHSAYLLEESDESSDIFRISVGNLPPKKSAAVELSFVTELAVEKEGRVVFVLPTVLNPRYSPADSPASASAEVPRIAGVNSPYTFDFEMHVKLASAITRITSPSNSLLVEIEETEDETKALVRLAEPHKADKDVEVQILSAEPFKPHALVEGGVVPSDEKSEESDFLSKPVVMLNFFPEFPSGSSETGEFIFVVDRSGSMSGDSIKKAGETLLLFLKSLPDGCHFNVVGFGGSYEHLFEKSELYNDESVEKACNHAQKLQANLGGTEILEPLKWVFQQPLIEGAPRQVFLLTDGEVCNTQQVIDLVQQNASSARCFTFGIGHGASTALIKGVARAGKGTAEFVLSQDRLQAKVIKTLKHALQPVMNDVGITWSVPAGYSVNQIPSAAPPIYSGDRMVLFGLLQSRPQERDTEVRECCVTLQGTLECGDQKENIEHSINFQIERKSDESISFRPKLTIHRLAAKSFVQEKQDQLDDLEQDCKEKEAIIKISKSSNVVSKLTSFVAVDKESHEPITAAMESRPIPLRKKYCAINYCASAGYANMYDPTIEDSYGGAGQKKYKACISRRSAKKRMDRGFSIPRQMEINRSSKEKPVSGAAVVRLEKATKNKKKGGMKGLFKRLSFRKKKDNSKSSEQTASETETGKGEDQAERGETSSSQRAEEERKDEELTTSPSIVTKESLMEIISLQRASGAWELTDQLAQLCGSTATELRRACPDTSPAAEDDGKVWATALALVLLAGKFADKKDEWEMVGKKGKKWLKGKFNDEAEYKNMTAVAAKTLNVPEPQNVQLE